MKIIDLFIAVLVLIVIGVALVGYRAKSIQRRKSFEHIRERYVSGLALVRYIQLNGQCSEEAAYQRLASFVKKHVPLDNSSSIERMLVYDRQSLLQIAQGFSVQNPAEIDKI
jgi:Tfp pilus assembly protein PilV